MSRSVFTVFTAKARSSVIVVLTHFNFDNLPLKVREQVDNRVSGQGTTNTPAVTEKIFNYPRAKIMSCDMQINST